MTHMTDDGDDLNDLIGGAASSIRSGAPLRAAPPASYQPKDFSEPCSKCGGTGRYHGWSGRLLGECFACKGAGKKVFKASAETRANNREKAAARKEKNLALDIEAFKAEFPHIWAWMENSTFAFAISLRDGLLKYGSLTDRQIAAAESAIAKYEAAKATRQAERAARPAAVAVDVSKLETAFATARANAARPGMEGIFVRPVKLQSGDTVVAFQPGSQGSQWQDMIFAKDANGKKLGYVKDGQFKRRFECTDAEAAAVLDCAQDPEKAAVAFGKAWSSCGICGRRLHNDESIERGIGPICAENFGW